MPLNFPADATIAGQEPEPARRGLRSAQPAGRRPSRHLDLEQRCGNGNPCACRCPPGLGFHLARSSQLPARDELLRPAGQRARLLPPGPPPPDGAEPAALQPERPDAGRLRPVWDSRRSISTGRPGTAGSARSWTARPSRTCPARACRSSASICRCTRTGPARWKATTTATTGPTRLSPSRIAGRSSRPRGRSPSTSRPGAGPRRSSRAS